MKTYILSVKREEKKGPVICSADSYVTFICRTKNSTTIVSLVCAVRPSSSGQPFSPITDGD